MCVEAGAAAAVVTGPCFGKAPTANPGMLIWDIAIQNQRRRPVPAVVDRALSGGENRGEPFPIIQASEGRHKTETS